MTRFRDLLNETAHTQTHLIVGSPAGVISGLVEFLHSELGITKNNPDLFVREFDAFGIAESRMIKNIQKNKVTQEGKRFFILGIHFITTEAQNALLKTLEEPNPDNIFFIIARRSEIFLPTLRSRCTIHFFPGINMASVIEWEESSAGAFLNSSLPERLLAVEEILKEDSVVAKRQSLALLDALELVLQKQPSNIISADLSLLIKSRKRLYMPGVLPKLILENIALGLSNGKPAEM